MSNDALSGLLLGFIGNFGAIFARTSPRKQFLTDRGRLSVSLLPTVNYVNCDFFRFRMKCGRAVLEV